MKNILILNIDTNRDQPIIIAKPPDSVPPATPEQAKEMVLIDIKCITESLCRLIDIAHLNGYGDKVTLTDEAILTLHQMKIEEEPKKEESNIETTENKEDGETNN